MCLTQFRSASVLIVVTLATHLRACLWDFDTLAMERQRFPEIHELITGHFLHHSQDYYLWRIADRKRVPEESWTPSMFDDIAVAYDKLKQRDMAIETIQRKMTRFPQSGLYESEANLGTFLIHAGKFQEGIAHIDQALQLNPQAHFGRELYQKLLVEYLVERRQEGATLPLCRSRPHENGFAAFLLKRRNVAAENRADELESATDGLRGMLRFGDFRSPILLEALGNLLEHREGFNDARMLAARAYLKASYEVDNSESAQQYRQLAESSLLMQYGRKLSDIEADLQEEIRQGDQFADSVYTNERRWIATGQDVDREFAVMYYGEDTPMLSLRYAHWRPWDISSIAASIAKGMLVTAVAALAWLAVRRWRMRKAVPDHD